MILPEDMRRATPRFAAAALTARLVEARDPQVEDDQIKIFAGGVDTRVTIQIALGGGFHVNEYRGNGATFAMVAQGSFHSLRKAIDRAIAIVRAKQAAEVAS